MVHVEVICNQLVFCRIVPSYLDRRNTLTNIELIMGSIASLQFAIAGIKVNLLAGRLFCIHACTPWP